jgi:hypothetical protein
MKHFQKFLTPYSTKVKLTLNPEGAQGALFFKWGSKKVHDISFT